MDTHKVLGQSYPAAAVLTDCYTVPANVRGVIVSSIKVCNQDDEKAAFRVSIAVAGAADASKQYQYFDVPIDGNDSFGATEGWTLGPGDVMRVRSDNGQCSFNVFGVEIS